MDANRIEVGVIVERRRSTNPWADYVWRPVAALSGAPAAEPWSELSADETTAQFYVGTAELQLFRTETANYRDNLSSGSPSLWAALRPTGDEQRPFQLFGVTADPAEGEAWTQTGDDVVDAVPMPEDIREWVGAFVAEHHVERSVYKRQRDTGAPADARGKPRARNQAR